MNEILNNLFLSVLTAAIPTVSVLAGWAVRKITNQLAAQIESDAADRALAEIAEAVPNAVLFAGQTYVDGLKAAGSFNEEAQRYALSLALKACLSSLSKAALKYIQENFGDAETYLTGRIEAEVKRQKLAA